MAEEGKQFSIENLNEEVSKSWQNTRQAGQQLNEAYLQVKSVHEDLRLFIEGLDEQWVDKQINEWAKDRLIEDVQSGLVQKDLIGVTNFKDERQSGSGLI